MNRRDFLKRLAACGLVAATPKPIFDLGYKSYKDNRFLLTSDLHFDGDECLDWIVYGHEHTRPKLTVEMIQQIKKWAYFHPNRITSL